MKFFFQKEMAKDCCRCIALWILIRFSVSPDPGCQNVADPMDPDPKHWHRPDDSDFPLTNCQVRSIGG